MNYALWWIFINFVCAEMVNWMIETMHADWTKYRQQWEYTHSIITVIKIFCFCALYILHRLRNQQFVAPVLEQMNVVKRYAAEGEIKNFIEKYG